MTIIRSNHGWPMLLAGLALSGCSGSASRPLPPPVEPSAQEAENPTCVSCGAELDDADLAYVESLAARGDVEAAFTLARHYERLGDRQQQASWERRAADMGHPTAQYNQWLKGWQCEDVRSTLAGLEKSVAEGDERPKQELVELRRTMGICKSKP